MNVTVLLSDFNHPIYPRLREWQQHYGKFHSIELVNDVAKVSGGLVLFLISCNQLVSTAVRDKYAHTLVLHASDLPRGRGWSPHIWEIIKGNNELVVSLLEAEDRVDSGRVWAKERRIIPDNALWHEINTILFDAELSLMSAVLNNVEVFVPTLQSTDSPTYHRKRTPRDSEIDVTKSIESQFDLLRVCDPNRFPAYTYCRGRKFLIKLEAAENQE